MKMSLKYEHCRNKKKKHEKCKKRARRNSSGVHALKVDQLRGNVYVFVYFRDYPEHAFTLNLNNELSQIYLQALIDLTNEGTGWGLCEFKNEDCYRRGRRLVGQHHQLCRTQVWHEGDDIDWLGWNRSKPKGRYLWHQGIQIGAFQGLVQPLGYKNLPLTKGEEKVIREEYRFRGYSVAKLADHWNVSESHIRKVLRGDKPPVPPSKDSINKGVSEAQPPIPSRVVLQSRGYGHD
jgi:hypothetical protein